MKINSLEFSLELANIGDRFEGCLLIGGLSFSGAQFFAPFQSLLADSSGPYFLGWDWESVVYIVNPNKLTLAFLVNLG
jgi:hypothetical protein